VAVTRRETIPPREPGGAAVSRIGERVGAIHTTSADEVQLFGFGVYVGREVPGPEAAGWLADMVREMGHDNPKIVLDSGKVVYGCECWFGPETEVRETIGGRRAVEVDIDQVRAEVRSR